jgi:hypothetical protein
VRPSIHSVVVRVVVCLRVHRSKVAVVLRLAEGPVMKTRQDTWTSAKAHCSACTQGREKTKLSVDALRIGKGAVQPDDEGIRCGIMLAHEAMNLPAATAVVKTAAGVEDHLILCHTCFSSCEAATRSDLSESQVAGCFGEIIACVGGYQTRCAKMYGSNAPSRLSLECARRKSMSAGEPSVNSQLPAPSLCSPSM